MIALLFSEINYKKGNLEKSEDNINSFWFNCTSNKQDWLYDNYPNILLGSLRLGFWHGGNIPKWNAFYREQYIDKNKDDKNFYHLNEAIKLWVMSTIGSIPGTGPKGS